MTDVQVREIDPADEQGLRSWWEVGEASSADRPLDVWPVWELARRTLPRERSDFRHVLLVATEHGRTVGAARLGMTLLDNAHLAQLDVHVLPDRRRRGIGRRLLADLEDRARQAGRTTAVASVAAPVDAESPGSLFAAAAGYPVASREESKVVDLASAAPTWARLDEQVTGALGGYRVAGFEDRVPDEHVDEFCDLLSVFMSSIPSGDLDLEDATWTPERLREHEQRMLADGETWILALGLTAEGRLCGFTELGIVRADPRHASVGGTLVLPEHRGHRVGLAMKLSTHRRVRELFETCQYVETANAGVNAAMNHVNDQLGYRLVERRLDVQRVL